MNGGVDPNISIVPLGSKPRRRKSVGDEAVGGHRRGERVRERAFRRQRHQHLVAVADRGALEPVSGGHAGYSCGLAILRWSSASSRIFSSTPFSRATSRAVLPLAAASLTISAALS